MIFGKKKRRRLDKAAISALKYSYVCAYARERACLKLILRGNGSRGKENMSKLLIVESPTKARTIGRMLGKEYAIMASMGHIRDLPEREFGIDIAHGFAPQYVDTARSKSVVRDLRAAAKSADEIYLAPDPDREGEAIAWHLAEVLERSTKAPFYRVSFHEITRSAIERAMQEKGEINRNLVDAQQARRVLDRIVGYQVSPLLWSRVEKGSSAGRVQSVALRLVVERERAIGAFVPEEYWVFSAVFRTETGEEFSARLFKIDAKEFRIGSGEEAAKLLDAVLHGAAPQVASVAVSERRRFAPAPFTTSTLQQAANVSLHYSATSTMRYAQQLYEGMDIGEGGSVGLITYMRTDSVTIAREAQIAAAAFIRDTYGEAYVPQKFNFYKNKAAAQEAHEAIRPTDVRRTPEAMAPYLDPMQLKLYSLIWRRFVASQMTPAVQNLTTVDVGVAGADARCRGGCAQLHIPGDGDGAAVSGILEGVRGGLPAEGRDARGGSAGETPGEAAVVDPRCGEGAEVHRAAAALHRSGSHQGAGGERHRSSFDLRDHSAHDSGSEICVARAGQAGSDGTGIFGL